MATDTVFFENGKCLYKTHGLRSYLGDPGWPLGFRGVNHMWGNQPGVNQWLLFKVRQCIVKAASSDCVRVRIGPRGERLWREGFTDLRERVKLDKMKPEVMSRQTSDTLLNAPGLWSHIFLRLSPKRPLNPRRRLRPGSEEDVWVVDILRPSPRIDKQSRSPLPQGTDKPHTSRFYRASFPLCHMTPRLSLKDEASRGYLLTSHEKRQTLCSYSSKRRSIFHETEYFVLLPSSFWASQSWTFQRLKTKKTKERVKSQGQFMTLLWLVRAELWLQNHELWRRAFPNTGSGPKTGSPKICLLHKIIERNAAFMTIRRKPFEKNKNKKIYNLFLVGISGQNFKNSNL